MLQLLKWKWSVLVKTVWLDVRVKMAKIMANCICPTFPESDMSRLPTAVIRLGTTRGRIKAFSIRRKSSPEIKKRVSSYDVELDLVEGAIIFDFKNG